MNVLLNLDAKPEEEITPDEESIPPKDEQAGPREAVAPDDAGISGYALETEDELEDLEI